MDDLLLCTLSMALSVSLLTRFDSSFKKEREKKTKNKSAKSVPL